MMDTVMTRPRRFTLESGKRSSELLSLAQLHVAAYLLVRASPCPGHLLQQPHVPRVPRHVPSSCATLTCRASSHGRTTQQDLIQVVLNVCKVKSNDVHFYVAMYLLTCSKFSISSLSAASCPATSRLQRLLATHRRPARFTVHVCKCAVSIAPDNKHSS